VSSRASGPRLVAVLGYSEGGTEHLHEICEARLRRAEELAGPDDVVLFSGWARRGRPVGEAELMAQSWRGHAARVVLDPEARSTLANAVSVAAAAESLGAREVVLVTSGWHGRRAAALLAAALRRSGLEHATALTDERGSVRARWREAACLLALPVQRRLARRAPRPERHVGARVETR
jgi:uncharacterized SAM-binding protein YcdF (DUF218 family)